MFQWQRLTVQCPAVPALPFANLGNLKIGTPGICKEPGSPAAEVTQNGIYKKQQRLHYPAAAVYLIIYR